MKKLNLIWILALLTIALLPLSSAVSSTIQQQYTTAPSNARWNSGASGTWQAQTFTANNTYDTDRVDVLLYCFTNAQTLTAYLYNTSGGVPQAAVFTFGTYSIPNCGGTVDMGYISINNTGSSYRVQNGTVYAIVLSTGNGAAQSWAWQYLAAGGFAGGNIYIGSSSPPATSQAGEDANFKIYGNTATSPPVISFQGQTPSNNSLVYYPNTNFTLNTTSSGFGGTTNTTHYLYNSSGSLIRQNNGTSQSNYTSTFSSLSVGTYLFNATASNGTTRNYTETRTLYVYNLSTGSITSPTSGSNVSQRLVNFTWTNATINPTASGVKANNFSLRIENQAGTTLAIIYNGSQLNLTNFDIYALNLATGLYTLRLTSQDSFNNTVNTTSQFNLTKNALLNITAKSIIDNTAYNTFNINIIGGDLNANYTTTTGLIQINIVKNITYNITLSQTNITTNNTLFSTNLTHASLNFSVYPINTIIINFMDELLDQKINWTTSYIELISTVYANNYSTDNGTLFISLLQPITYTARYEATGYTERFYQFTVDNDTYQTVNLYLLNSSYYTNITIGIIDETTLALPNAIVKALKYDLITNDYWVVEICTTGIAGTCLMDLTFNDEYYYFIVEYEGETVKITNPEYITETEITIPVILGAAIGENFLEYKSIDFLMNYNTANNLTTFFYNDADNVAGTFTLRIYSKNLLNGTTLLYEEESTDSTSTITIQLNRTENVNYEARSYYTDNDVEKVLGVLTIPTVYEDIDLSDAEEDLGMQTAFTAFLVVIVILIGLAEWIPIIIPLSLLFGSWLNLNLFSEGVLTALTGLGVIITIMIYRWRSNR